MAQYSTTWYHLDKNNKVLASYEAQACFGSITRPGTFEKDCQYLLYVFKGQMEVTQEEAQQYFLFLKSIPEFKELMPKSCSQMAKDMEYKVDLHKYNGTKIFTMLTLIRAVVEDPEIVREVISFDRKFKYSISNFGILKLCGSVHTKNTNHWITMCVDKRNLDKMFRTQIYWDALEPCIKTGLGRNIYNTFVQANEGYAVSQPVGQADINKVRAEKHKPKVAVKQQQYETAVLQLGF